MIWSMAGSIDHGKLCEKRLLMHVEISRSLGRARGTIEGRSSRGISAALGAKSGTKPRHLSKAFFAASKVCFSTL